MAPRPRKRVRRRRVTENFDDSSDSSASSSSSASSQSNDPTAKITSKSSSDSSESSSESESTDSSSSSSSSSASSSARPTAKRGRLAKKQTRVGQQQPKQDAEPGLTETTCRSPSPVAQSPPAPLPSSFFDPDLALPYLDSPPDFSLPAGFETRPATRQVDGLQSARQTLAQDEDRFRAWYMTTIVDRFPNELDQLRTSCNSQKAHSNLDLLVAALGSGVDIFDDSVALSSSSDTATKVSHQNPSSSKMALDDHHLVLESLDLADAKL
ncbi:hypothetical protein PtA15_15A240 [Puccinia triticina]|uniref:Ribosome assembly protein 3 n=1 Tax=Puccinia triticina TaxID=208348 RepID=A0ABY7D402_9BASI|nr:uncharacterized protein PtA15_15A240 [Puccinia triticina]WAQ91848.1 hypothetical protein PtA15_15A240 [Puccinia triticina]WAR62643.1 hypothetical protein PtB15_15B230 [Puccinia triticina]